MKRSAIQRKTPMRSRREGPTAPRETKPAARATVQPIRRGTYAGSTTGQAVLKELAIRHLGYEAAARDLGYCMRCRRPCRPQFCHRDAGKGAGIKTDVRLGWPGCDDCHALLGGHAGGGRMPKEQRRDEEDDLAGLTRAAVIAAGTWPKSLPHWIETMATNAR